jgi:glycerol-3-phosphate dehydrogenase
MPMSAVGQAKAALLVPETSDGRVLFAIPWRGHYLIGTTDTEAEPHESPHLLPDEAAYLTEHVNHYLAPPLSTDQITGGFAGLRPLLQPAHNSDQTASRSVIRDHEVEVDPQTGLISIMGGKWTTYRLMAEETIDTCCRLINQQKLCSTEDLIMAGGIGFDQSYKENFRFDHTALPVDVTEHLANTYGTNATKVANLIAENNVWKERLVDGHPFIVAEVIYAIREEMAQTLPDVLMRRIRLGLVDWQATITAIPVAGASMAAELNWSDADRLIAESSFRSTIQGFMQGAGFRSTAKEKA